MRCNKLSRPSLLLCVSAWRSGQSCVAKRKQIQTAGAWTPKGVVPARLTQLFPCQQKATWTVHHQAEIVPEIWLLPFPSEHWCNNPMRMMLFFLVIFSVSHRFICSHHPGSPGSPVLLTAQSICSAYYIFVLSD